MRIVSDVNVAVNTTRFLAPSGLHLAVHTWGTSSPDHRVPVLLAHPTGFHGRVWAPVVELLLAAEYAVWSFDFRGHGDSDESPDGYEWAAFATDVLAVVDHLELAGRNDLLGAGHSKGAASLLRAQHDRPATFERIWAFEPIMFPGAELRADPDFPLAVGARRRRNEWNSPSEAYEAYRSKPPLDIMSDESLRAYVEYGLRDRGDGVYELKCRPEVEAAVYTMGPVNGMFDRLPAIEVPVRVVCGATTDAIVPKLAEMIVQRLPQGSLEVWDDHGHFGPQADPRRAADSIVAFRAL